MKLIIVSGLSGSGKSVALNTLEDLGYYCIDNLPVGLLEPFATQWKADRQDAIDKAAVGIDARNQVRDLEHFDRIVAELETRGIVCETLFLQADDDILLKRFSETRRKHPLSRSGVALADAIREERRLLAPIAHSASLQLDTTHTNLYQLRDLVRERIANRPQDGLSLLFKSFGYKHGLPDDADFVFDARCLPNPHWEAGLRPFTGRDPAVKQYLEKHSVVREMLEEIQSFIERWIPRFERESRNYLTIAVGCTGGQHRSVYLVERLGSYFSKRYPSVITRHRELS
jgi:UPF0042 nucleotide-binding protein